MGDSEEDPRIYQRMDDLYSSNNSYQDLWRSNSPGKGHIEEAEKLDIGAFRRTSVDFGLNSRFSGENGYNPRELGTGQRTSYDNNYRSSGFDNYFGNRTFPRQGEGVNFKHYYQDRHDAELNNRRSPLDYEHSQRSSPYSQYTKPNDQLSRSGDNSSPEIGLTPKTATEAGINGRTANDPGFGSARAPVDFGVNTFPLTSLDPLDPLSNLLSFASCPPGYKEFSLYKEKGPHDIADALLSLKHAVVHPGMNMNGQLPPLSPNLGHFGQSPSSGMGPGHGLSYSFGHQGQNYSPMGGMQYPGPPPHSQYGDPIGGQHMSNIHGQGQGNMFPSMSVNVSMSMNVGMPPNINNHPQYPPSHQNDQWAPHYHMGQPSGPGACSGQFSPPQGGGLKMQTQYSGYMSPQAQAYNASYSFSSDLRGAPLSKDIVYKTSPDSCRSGSRERLFSMGKRSKASPSRQSSTPTDCGKINLCRMCGKTYARPSTLKTHMRTHSGEKPYRCQTCNKSFSQAANLTAHLRTHSGEKPFRCPICDRRFSQSSSVTTHMRTHSGERPYRCRMCKKAFSDSSTLTKHLRIHSGEKPYQCKLCLLRFSQSGNLNRHMRVHASSA